MDIYFLFLRLIHIVAGVIWGGGALFMEFFIGRTILVTGESGQKFAQHLMKKVRLHRFMTIMAVSTVLAGALLYWHDSNGFTSAWVRSSAGIGFGIGSVFGLIAFVSGAIFGSSNVKLAEIGARIQGKPTDEQFSQIRTIQKQIKTASPIHTFSMILAILFMATARYLNF